MNKEFIELCYRNDLSIDKHMDEIFHQAEEILGSNAWINVLAYANDTEAPHDKKGLVIFSEILEKLDIQKISIQNRISLITISNVYRDKIPYWKEFVDKCYQDQILLEGEKESKKLFMGFICHNI